MARRRPIFTGIRWSKPVRRMPIKIPQPEDRPLRLHQKSLIKAGEKRPHKPWYQVLHRRGPRRPKVGEDPREARATPKGKIRGTLPERIMHKYLIDVLRFVEGVDFTFQSSLQGGRMELGGIVADFLFPYLRIVLNPAGPTHDQFLRQRKDEEQAGMLAELGYTMYLIKDEDVYDQWVFEDAMRRIFSLGPKGGGGNVSSPYSPISGLDEIEARVIEIRAMLDSFILTVT